MLDQGLYKVRVLSTFMQYLIWYNIDVGSGSVQG